MDYISALIFFVFGTLLGSFLNVVILRLPNEENLGGRSHCTNCRHTLTARDLVPLFSWLFLKGRCRYCNAKISPRYFIIELITGILFAVCLSFIQPVNALSYLMLFKYLLAVYVLLAVFVIDLEHYLILDIIIFPAVFLMSAVNLTLDILSSGKIFSLHGFFINGIVAALAASFPFFMVWFLSKGKWMGFGDVKLALFLGVALGFPNVFVGLMVAIFLGGIFSSFLLIFTSRTLKSQVPFGTFLSIGAVISLFYGEKLLNWYLAILGF